MSTPGKRGLRWPLRTKLLLVSLTLLVIPFAGYLYIQEMESFLRAGMSENLRQQASTISTVLHGRSDLFEGRRDIVGRLREDGDVYIRELNYPIQLDGYIRDWDVELPHARSYSSDHLIFSRTRHAPTSLSFAHLLGIHGRYLYVMFDVTDDKIVYRRPNSLRLDQSDHLRIAMRDAQGEYLRYQLTTQAPGWVNAFLMPRDADNPRPVRPEIRIKGEWQESDKGYVIELRIPVTMLGDRLGFAIGDVDDDDNPVMESLIGTSDISRQEELGAILRPSPEIEALITGLERGNSRIWVVDSNRHVLAISGSLNRAPGEQSEPGNILRRFSHAFYRLLLTQPAHGFKDELSGVSRLSGKDIDAALNGQSEIRWRDTPDGRAVIASAASPVWNEGQVIGAVVAEQTTNQILTLQNRALENLVNLTLLAFVCGALFLLVFATRLSLRVRRLHRQAEHAIAQDGRVVGLIDASQSGDELGDLSRSFADMLDRLSQYTRYLETMSGKLSHELRTPLTVVKSSLENLEMQDLSEDARRYSQRAHEGVDRLSRILSSLSEATRLEQAMQSSERERYDLTEVIRGCIEGYKLAYPQSRFASNIESAPMLVEGLPEHAAQMFDKLISNAIEFSDAGKAIVIELHERNKHARLSVSNNGPALPGNMRERLFDSMVSQREPGGKTAHLGLGLYIARLIAEYHHGRISACDREDGSGVVVSVEMPLMGE